jgi:DTW domain-containing protein YfiP
MAYEVFKRTGVRVESPALSIVPDGRISINAAAARLLVEAGIKWVVLLWDRANHKMAVKAAQKGDKNAYAVSLSPERYSGSLRAKAFVAHIGWSAPRRQMLPATWNEKEKMFELTLPEKYLGSG